MLAQSLMHLQGGVSKHWSDKEIKPSRSTKAKGLSTHVTENQNEKSGDQNPL